jgi:hypothetical protein
MAATLAMAAAGCGSDASARDEGDTADTARYELVVTRTDKEGRLVLNGSYDYVRRQGTMAVKLEGTDDAGTDSPTEASYFGDRYYVEQEHEGKLYWVVEREEDGVGYPDEEIVPGPESDVDPKEALRVILAAGHEQERGREEVRGAETTHYRVELHPQDLTRELGGKSLDDAGGPFTADVWADDANRVRRIRTVEEETATLTYEFWDFGTEVEVERPPADRVLTQREFDCLVEPNADCKPKEKQ